MYIQYIKMTSNTGHLHIYTGCMYSRKTTQMLQHVCNYALLSSSSVCIVNHALDTRGAKSFSTHNPLLRQLPANVQCISTDKLCDIDTTSYKMIGIDEAQFFPDLHDVVCKWIAAGVQVVVAGLNGDAQMNPFGEIHKLICKADRIDFCTAICTLCIKEHSNGVPTSDILNTMTASFSKKIAGDAAQVVDVGAVDKYIPVCRRHYDS